MSTLLFRYWTLDIHLESYTKCISCTLIVDIGLSHRFVQRTSTLMPVWVSTPNVVGVPTACRSSRQGPSLEHATPGKVCVLFGDGLWAFTLRVQRYLQI